MLVVPPGGQVGSSYGPVTARSALGCRAAVPGRTAGQPGCCCRRAASTRRPGRACGRGPRPGAARRAAPGLPFPVSPSVGQGLTRRTCPRRSAAWTGCFRLESSRCDARPAGRRQVRSPYPRGHRPGGYTGKGESAASSCMLKDASGGIRDEFRKCSQPGTCDHRVDGDCRVPAYAFGHYFLASCAR